MKTVFFYGLFMDVAYLEQQGLKTTIIGKARLPHYRIVIGKRASLIPAEASTAYGVLMKLSDAEAQQLYAEPSVCDYLPQAVVAQSLENDQPINALCYNLPPEAATIGTNAAYAAQLAALAEQLGFPEHYVSEINTTHTEPS
ncbi:gamma-glutamylcyclotransferase family protein [Acanthopleuribacter pedis]|uniref:Gamma-glutamylcyclotransferase n=1 Tax=Acanthopleuribacter pedis TaxID=442870 RepID=A0A8J7U5J9_9BACT|nr:gamma-glutamylcyclotransferase family protein [Acanthopleuribacter pedis]MBO1319401.1 gamma-glutamylcyclotransferase [Acanthopleuribacter pedis]